MRVLVAAMLTTTLAIGGLLGCVKVDLDAIEELSLEEKDLLGRKVFELAQDELGLVESGPVASGLRSLGQELSRELDVPVRFHLLDHELDQATSFPSGDVVVTKRWLRRAESSDELLGVLLEQVAHVGSRDVTRTIVASYQPEVLRSALAGGQGGLLEAVAANLTYQGSFGRHSDATKARSDLQVVLWLRQLGADASAWPDFLGRYLSVRRKKDYHARSHPIDDKRVERCRGDLAQVDLVRALDGKAIGASVDELFAELDRSRKSG
ncbi:MAG: hypothetical protein AAF533_26960 [Acidobacteriota bacterium]